MNPNLALLICLVFVVLVLRYAGERIKSGSFGLWVPTIWMLYCASRPLAAWSASSPDDFRVEEGSGLDRLFLSGLIGLAFVILNKRRLNWSQVLRENRVIVMLCVYLAVSALWSDYTLISWKRWFRFCGTPLMALIVLTEVSPGEAMERIFRRSAYILIPLSLTMIRYFNEIGIQYDAWTGERMWVGVTTQKNSLARFCLISSFFLMWAIIRAWPKRKTRGVKKRIRADFVILLISVYLLKGPGSTYSATSIATLVLGVSMYIFLLSVRKLGLSAGSTLAGIAIACAIFSGVAIPIIGGSGASGLLALLGRDATFTGRTEVWQAILPVALLHPILGVGFGSFWINPPFTYSLSIMVNEAHNGYLDVFVELGFVGFSLFLVFLLCFYRDARKAMAYDFHWASFSLCMLLIILIHNITESSFLRPTNHMGAVMVFLAMLVRQLHRAKATAVRRPYTYQATQLSPAG
jgi:exopolysaccharide production protein ExoQ